MSENYLIYVTTGVREYAEMMQRRFEKALEGTVHVTRAVNCRMGDDEIYNDITKYELVDFNKPNKLAEDANLDC